MYNIKDFGAVGDGVTKDTLAIQSAIDKCSSDGGGRVYVPSGCYLTGSIFLLDNVDLHLEIGALLKASAELEDYNSDDAYEQNYGSVAEKWLPKHMIIAVERKNVSITGGGHIDGAGDHFFGAPAFYPEKQWMNGYGWRSGFASSKDPEKMRPGQLICFIECENVHVEGVTITNTPCWTIFLHGCENVTVRGVKIFNPIDAGNTDGIDVDCCRYVSISDCLIDTGDDSITFRCSSKRLKNPKPCEYVTVTNCCLAASACNFRIGVGTGTIRHIRVSNISVSRAGTVINFATSYNSNGCAEIEDVNFTGISAYDTAFAIKAEANIGSIRNVTLSDIRAYTLSGINLSAGNGGVIENFNIKDAEIHLLPEKEELTPRRRAARGDTVVTLKGVKDSSIKNVKVYGESQVLQTWDGPIGIADCSDLTVENISDWQH